jgi:hypothetical protein
VCVCVCDHGRHPVSGRKRYILCNLFFELQVVHSHTTLCLLIPLSSRTTPGFHGQHFDRTHKCIYIHHNHNRFRLALLRATFPLQECGGVLPHSLPACVTRLCSHCLLSDCCVYSQEHTVRVCVCMGTCVCVCVCVCAYMWVCVCTCV